MKDYTENLFMDEPRIQNRKEIYKEIVKIYNLNYEDCLNWISNFEYDFGYITMASFIRMIEMKTLERQEKDHLLLIGMSKMNFGCYENFFELSHDIQDLNQKMFMIMSIDLSFDYISKRFNTNKKTYIVWEVIGKYYREEYQRLCPFESLCDIDSEGNNTSRVKIAKFFSSKGIQIEYTKKQYNDYSTSNIYDYILGYFR
jgi:hypothetical protein